MIVYTVISLVLSLGLLFGGVTFLRKGLRESGVSKKKELMETYEEVQGELTDLLKYTNSYASKGQFDTLLKMIEQVQVELENEKKSLVDIEAKLDTAQKDVEGKEAQQQELKSAKEEDELALEDLLSNYSQISEESVTLEQKLAQSLKNLDQMMEELTLTQEQKQMLEELSGALTDAGSLFRDLITEYQSVNERLEMLRTQHDDLEDEYTKLVEQQLGE